MKENYIRFRTSDIEKITLALDITNPANHSTIDRQSAVRNFEIARDLISKIETESNLKQLIMEKVYERTNITLAMIEAYENSIGRNAKKRIK